MQEEAALTFTPPSYTTVVIIVIHKGLGLPQVLKEVLKKRTQKKLPHSKKYSKKEMHSLKYSKKYS